MCRCGMNRRRGYISRREPLRPLVRQLWEQGISLADIHDVTGVSEDEQRRWAAEEGWGQQESDEEGRKTKM